MRLKSAQRVAVLAVGLVTAVSVGFWDSRIASAQSPDASQPDMAALSTQIDALRGLIPSQSHAMADVDYHFANLWFAAKNSNWPLAEFYLNEAKSHLNWAVRIRPVRRLSSGAEFDLRPVLQGVENSSLADLKVSIDKHDHKAFETAYRQTISACYACHRAAEKPYLRLHIPEAPATRIIDLRPNAG